MSRLIAITADELLSGTNSNVMGAYYSTDDEVPGVVVLGSLNAMPNPDLTDLNERSRLRAWNLKAPPAPDSWDVLMRRTTKINAGGSHTLLKDGVPMLRQNQSLLRWRDHTYQQDHPLVVDRSLTDLGADEPTDLAPVLEPPRVEVINTGFGGGYPAGSLYFSYFYLVGTHPTTTTRITNSGPAIQLTGITQGQMILFTLPDEIPNSCTGVGFCAGPSPTTMKDQKRVDLRGRVVTETIDHGPYRRQGAVVSETGTNRSYMGSFREHQPPIAWRTHSNLNLMKGSYKLSYSLKTRQGWTAAQQINTVSVDADHKGEVLAWAPHKQSLQREDIEAWRPEFEGGDGDWYTFEDARAGYDLRHIARLHTKKVNKKDWKSNNEPVKINRSEKDHSGVPGPTDVLELPVATGAEQMDAGRYAIRVNTASEKLDMRSRPSPRYVDKTPGANLGKLPFLRDTGVQAGGAPSGVTDQTLRVFRPQAQSIRNSRLVEIDPATGQPTLHWETFTNSNVTVTDGDGFISVVANSTDTTGTPLNLRRSPPEPIDPNRYYAFRFRMNITSQNATTGGRVRMALRFLDSSKAQISLETLEDFRGVQDVRAYRTAGPDALGPAGGTAHIDFPSTAAYVQAVVQLVGGAGDAPVATFTVSNLGMWLGRAASRKVHDLVLGEDTPGHDAWPVPDEQADTPGAPTTAALPHAPGPYCRLVTSPNDPATHMSPGVYVEQKGFEDGSATTSGLGNTGVWQKVETGGATFSAGPAFALRGAGGGLSNVTTTSSSTTWGGYIWKDFSNAGRNTFGAQAAFRIKSLPTNGSTVTVLGVMQGASTTGYLARFQINSAGLLQYRYWNGTEQTALTTGVTLQKGDDVRLEMSFAGLRVAGSNGSVKFDVKRNDRPAITSITQAGLGWSGLGTTQRVMVGFQDGTATGSLGRLLVDRIKITIAGVGESVTPIPGNMVEYWAPEGQPAHYQDHFMTGARWPVKPGQNRVFSCYLRYRGVTTPTDGASVFRLVSHDVDGNPITDHGYVATGLKGRDYWDRISLSYTTPQVAADGVDAAYVQVTRNEIGDGVFQAMGFQDEIGINPSSFTRTNANDGSFNVIFKTTLSNGPKDGKTDFSTALRRMRAVATEFSDVNATVTQRIRGAQTVGGLATATWMTNIANLSPAYQYVELETTLHTDNNTKSPEIRAVFVDITRDRPVLCMQDGRDFPGGAIAYQLTPASPIPTVVRKELADGSIGLEHVGRGIPRRLKLSVQAFTELAKHMIERNAATDEPLFRVEVPHLDTAYTISMAPELQGNAEQEPDGTVYYDYVAEGLEADIINTDDL